MTRPGRSSAHFGFIYLEHQHGRVVAIVAAAALVASLATSQGGALAATPSSGTLGPTSGSTIAWDFAPVGPGVSSGGTVEFLCAPVYCDPYALTVVLPTADAQFYQDHKATLTITYTWSSTQPDDMDIFAFAPDGTESGPGTPDDASTGPGIEVLSIANPASGVWTIESHVGITPAPTAAHAVAQLTWSQIPPVTPPVLSGNAPQFTDVSPGVHYETADILGRANAGEPSLGTSWQSGAAMYMAGTQVSRITFDAAGHPNWTDVTPTDQSVVNEDAILFSDHATGALSNRTFIDGLLVAGANADVSDNDGASWTHATWPIPHSPDHETLGAGPYADPKPPGAGLTGYPNAVYYCSQNILQVAGAFCARSDNGGLTFNPSVLVFGPTSPCGAITGHLKVAPDGTVYLPQLNCKRADGLAGQGMAISRDNGQTWSYAAVPDSTARAPNTGTDPSVGIGSAGSVYFGYEDGSGHPKIAVSHDHGQSWSSSFDAGAMYGIQNTKFPEVVAGDDNRAAFAFLGTTSAGDEQAASFPGVWYLYVAFTYDGGKSWTTVNATPADPVQRGCVWNGGGSNACRNLLDFNDATIDAQGRVLVAYTDGCKNIDFSYASLVGEAEGAIHGPSNCDSDPNAYASTDKVNFDALARQGCGEGLLSAFDPGFSQACAPPQVASVSPVPGAQNVPTTSTVSATFSEIVTSATISLTDASGKTVRGTVSCTAPCVKVTFTPSARLKLNTTYRASATGANSAGTARETWSFTTGK